MEETAFASYADYSSRYGTDAGEERVSTLLSDASGFLAAEYERRYGCAWEQGAHPVFDRNAAAVCCGIVARMLATPEDLYGASQYSQGTGVYSASLTFANPTGDMYLSAADKRRLGLAGGRMRSIQAATWQDRC